MQTCEHSLPSKGGKRKINEFSCIRRREYTFYLRT